MPVRAAFDDGLHLAREITKRGKMLAGEDEERFVFGRHGRE
jgi:hypothetical protein